MLSKVTAVCLSLIWLTTGYAQCQLESKSWDDLPHVGLRPSAEGLQIKAKGFTVSTAELWDVDHDTGRSVSIEHPNKLVTGNYHWLQLSGFVSSCSIELATTYYDAKRAPSPRHLLKQDKASLVITPIDLPKEHQQFRGKESWWFEVRKEGRKMANQIVYYRDSVGNRLSLITNEEGRVQVTFPDYITDTGMQQANHGRPPVRQFSLWLSSDDQQHISGFEYRYAPNPDNLHSLLWGGILACLGMVASVLLLVRIKRPKKRRATIVESE